MHEGNVAFIATDKGLVRWQFLLQWKPDDGKWIETYDIVYIENTMQMDCVMSETDAIFYKLATQ